MSEPYVPTYDELFPELEEDAAAAKQSYGVDPAAWAAARSRVQTKTEIFSVPLEEQRYKALQGSSALIDSVTEEQNTQSRICADVIQKFKVALEVSLGASDRSLTVVVSGPRQAVLGAKKALLAKLQTQAEAEVVIPKEHHRAIIGKGGEKLKRLSNETSCNIRIPNQEDPEGAPIVITGTTENIQIARHKIMLVSDELAKKDVKNLDILKAYHPLLAGFKNQNIQRIQEATGARVNVPPPSVDKDEITVTGEKNAVAAAVMQIMALYEQMKQTCGELTAKVPKAQHRFVIGRKGVNLQEIMEKTGVVVEMPKQEDETDEIVLRGPQQNLVHALTYVYEKANSVVQATVTAPYWLHRHIIGKRGNNLKGITEKCGADMSKVNISFPDEGDLIEIEGPPEEVNPVKDILQQYSFQLQSTLTFKDIDVDPQYHRHLVGRGGSTINKLRDDSGAQINMPDPEGDRPRMIRVEGTPTAVADVAAQIGAIVRKLEDSKTVELPVEQRFHSILIGTKGAGIREIIEKFNGLAVRFPGPNVQSDIVTITGDKHDVDACSTYIKALVMQLAVDNYRLEVSVFKQFHRNVIGTKGAVVNGIKEKTNGVRIDIPDQKDESDMITLTGKKPDVEKARDMILRIQNDIASIVTEKIEIDIKHHANIIGKGGKVLRSIQTECGGVQITFPDAKKKSKEVVIKGPEEDVSKAKASLLDLANTLAASEEAELKVERKHVKHIVGRNTKGKKAIEDESGARIFVNRDDKDGDSFTIIGKRGQVAAAKTAILARVKQLESVIETTTAIEAEYHKHFVANRGRVINDLTEEFGGVIVTFPKKDGGDEVAIKGPSEDVEKLKARLAEIVDTLKNSVTIEVEIPSEHYRAILSGGGRNVQGLQADFDVNIKFPPRDAKGDNKNTVKISGLKDNCDKVAEKLQEMIPVVVVVPCQRDYHRFIIGKGGADVRALMDKYNVYLNFPKRASESDEIQIKGKDADCQDCKKALEAKIEELDSEKEDREARSYTVVLKCAAMHHRTIIGKGGDRIKEFRTKYPDVQIDFPRRNRDGDLPTGEAGEKILVRGYQDKADACAEDLRVIIKELELQVEVTVDIDPIVHGKIIGAKGAGIKALQQQFGVRVDFPRDKTSSVITIRGEEAPCNDCREELLNLEADYIEEAEEEFQQEHELDQYLQPPSKQVEKKKSTEPFIMTGAPGQASAPPAGKSKSNKAQKLPSEADFPDMGGAGKAQKPGFASAWGKKGKW
jgi:predicted PilT family ATPase